MSILAAAFAALGGSGGGGGGSIAIATNIEISGVAGGATSCGVTFGTTGGITYTGNANSLTPSTWGSSVAGADYEILVTNTSGTPSTAPGGWTSGNWIALSSARGWTVSQNSPGQKDWTATVQVREIANTGNITTSRTITASAVYEF